MLVLSKCREEREMLRNNYPELVHEINNLIEQCDYPLEKFKDRNNWLIDYMDKGLR